MSGPRLLHYVASTFDDNDFGTIPRFDHELHKVFPDLHTVKELPKDLDPKLDIVIAGNHRSLDVPSRVTTIVYQTGCAQTRLERDAKWRTPETQAWAHRQRRMFERANRIYVAFSEWTRDEFMRQYDLPLEYAEVIVPAVPIIEHQEHLQNPRKVILGDFGDHRQTKGDWNLGTHLGRALQTRRADWEIRRLRWLRETPSSLYQAADAFLYLAAAEGTNYRLIEAEAAGLPIVMTDTAHWCEFKPTVVIPWADRADMDALEVAVEQALHRGRTASSYYVEHTYEKWHNAWRALVVGASGLIGTTIPALRKPPSVRDAIIGIGLGGLGWESASALPLIRTLHDMGARIFGLTETGSRMLPVWKRCRYIERASDRPADFGETPLRWIVGPTSQGALRWHAQAVIYNPVDPRIEPEWSRWMDAARELGRMDTPSDLGTWLREPLSEPVDDVAVILPGAPEVSPRVSYLLETAGRAVRDGKTVVVFGSASYAARLPLAVRNRLGMHDLERELHEIARCRYILAAAGPAVTIAASLGRPAFVLRESAGYVKDDPFPSPNVVLTEIDDPSKSTEFYDTVTQTLFNPEGEVHGSLDQA